MSYTNGLDKPDDYFNTILWTGDGTSSRSLTGTGFQPDWTWIKRRSDAQAHSITDSVRGVTKSLRSDTNAAEDTNNANGYVTSFDTDGFTVAKGSDPSRTNTSGATYVGWNWLAGTSVSGNSGGSGTAKAYSGSVNTTSGFSIIKYIGNATAGQTIPHHLGVTPAMVIVKNIDATTGDTNWSVLHKSHFGTNNHLYLNLTNANDSNASRFNGTAPTSSNFTLGGADAVNKNDSDHIAYVFAEKKGYSKFGSYTGNGNADGTFVYTGFKPAWVMLKETSGTSDWSMYDNKREPFNVADSTLEANTSDAEAVVSGRPIDILSNGFKLRGDSSFTNESGATYIYMAFAENPFVTGASGIPCTAR